MAEQGPASLPLLSSEGPAAAATAPPAAQPPAPAVADARFAKCGFAKLLGDNGLEYYVQKYEIVLGRRSKAGNVDVVLGDSAVLSRQHAKIYYNFEQQRWELVAEGKNGVSVNGSLLTPQSGPRTLHSQDFLQAGENNFYFLLPRTPRKPRPSKSKAGTPTPPEQQQQEQPERQQEQQQLQGQQQQSRLQPFGSGPMLPGVGGVGLQSGAASPRLGLASSSAMQRLQSSELPQLSFSSLQAAGPARARFGPGSSMGSLELGLLSLGSGVLAPDETDGAGDMQLG